MNPDLSGRVALVTGAASGIGRATAAHLSDAGAAVVGLDLQTEPSDDGPAFDDLVESGELVVGDVSDPDAVDAAIETADAYGMPTIAVNNAGTGAHGRIDEIDPETFRQTFDVHVGGTYNVCRRLLPRMAEEGAGSVVNVASTWGLLGGPGTADYGAAKGALVNLTRQLAADFSPAGVRVNAVAPGFVKTAMNRDVWDPAVEPKADYRLSREDATDRTMLPYLGEPEDVASLIAFLASDDARFLTGAVIPVDGGWTAW